MNRRISCFSFWSRSHVSLVSGVFCWSFWSFCPLDSCVLSSFIAAPCAPYLLVNKHAKIPLNSDVLRRFYCIVVFPAFSFAVAVVCPWFLGLFCWSFLVVFPIRFLRFKQLKAVCLAFQLFGPFPLRFLNKIVRKNTTRFLLFKASKMRSVGDLRKITKYLIKCRFSAPILTAHFELA